VAVQLPTPSQLREVASEVGLNLTDADLTSFIELMRPNVAAYNVVDAMPDNLPPVRYPRTPGYRPDQEENTHNAWYVKTTVDGAPAGKLAGKTVALKDNIMLAGVPMMNGSATLEGYTPDIDATVVERILDAGGTILGKAHCEALCLSGGSHTNATGPVHNPHKMGYSAGGSSSGSAVLVALGEVDMALGGDQGGSIRMSITPGRSRGTSETMRCCWRCWRDRMDTTPVSTMCECIRTPVCSRAASRACASVW
jgi:amidase